MFTVFQSIRFDFNPVVDLNENYQKIRKSHTKTSLLYENWNVVDYQRAGVNRLVLAEIGRCGFKIKTKNTGRRWHRWHRWHRWRWRCQSLPLQRPQGQHHPQRPCKTTDSIVRFSTHQQLTMSCVWPIDDISVRTKFTIEICSTTSNRGVLCERQEG